MDRKKGQMRFTLGLKLSAMVVLLGVILSVCAITVSYQTFSTTMMAYYERLGTNLTRTLATQLDTGYLDKYYETGEMDARYISTQRFIRDLAESNDVIYLYVVRPHDKGVTFLFDSDMELTETGDYSSGGYCALGTYVDLIGEFARNLDKLLAGEPVSPIIQEDPSYGWMMTAMTPILHEDGTVCAYVMTDISMQDVMDSRREFLLGLALLLLGLTVGFIVLFLFILRRQVVQPINLLTSATGDFIGNNETELASGEAVVNVPEIHTGDEIQQLGDAFRQMEEDMITYVHNFALVTAEKERIGAELNVATQIQADMLPRIFPAFPERKEFDIFASMNPAKEVGGDFYDFFMTDDDHLGIVIADVSGKGVPAALFMVIAKTLIKNHAQFNITAPGDVFTQTNEQLCEGNDAGLFVTGWMGVLEISTGKFVYVNAGHNPPLLKRAGGGFDWLKSRPGFVLAGMEGVRYRENTIQLNPGDQLFLYTDGVTEATDTHKELFGEARLQAALNEAPDVPVTELLPRIRARIDEFVGEAEQFDDITMLSMLYKGEGGC